MLIGWFTRTRSLDVASVRYRCFHMAWALRQQGVDGVVYTKPTPLIADLAHLDAVVIVKRLDRDAEQVAQAAWAAGKPVFLDLCDDLLASAQGPLKSALHREVFGAMAPRLRAVVTTNEAFSDRLRSYGLPMPPVVQIPDIAETRAIFAAVSAWGGALPERALEAPAIPVAPPEPRRRSLGERWARVASLFPRRRKRVIWFGNHGGPLSNFGILSLLSAATALRRTAATTPIELVILSNDKPKYDAFIPLIGVPSRYVDWSPTAVYDELEHADVALLTNGDDEYSQVKSANRAVQALACGIPVVASGNPASRALGDAVILDDFEAGLGAYLGNRSATAAAVRKGRAVITETFSPEAVSRQWMALLTAAPPFPGITPAAQPSPSRRIDSLVLIATGNLPPSIVEAVQNERNRGRNPMLLVMPNAASPGVVDFLVRERLIPVMAHLGKLQSNDPRWLRDAVEVRIAGQDIDNPAAIALAALARAHDTPVIYV